jgi:hypothetical protein
MNELQKKQLALLEDTAASYTLETRCIDFRGVCQYFVQGKKGCAIGRLIPDKELCRQLDKGIVTATGGVSNTATRIDAPEVFALIPLELQEYGIEFLSILQGLHDYLPNWSDCGLSEKGKEYVNSIKNQFGLNKAPTIDQVCGQPAGSFKKSVEEQEEREKY